MPCVLTPRLASTVYTACYLRTLPSLGPHPTVLALVVAVNFTFDIFFFFQAEDGIRDYKVTGVQTCALPISLRAEAAPRPRTARRDRSGRGERAVRRAREDRDRIPRREIHQGVHRARRAICGRRTRGESSRRGCGRAGDRSILTASGDASGERREGDVPVHHVDLPGSEWMALRFRGGTPPHDAADPSRAGYERILILLSRAVPGRRSAGAQRQPRFRSLDRPARGARVSLHRFFEAALRLGDGGHGEPPHLRPRREVDVHLSSDRQLGAKEGVARERRRVPAVAHREIA